MQAIREMAKLGIGEGIVEEALAFIGLCGMAFGMMAIACMRISSAKFPV